MSHHIMHFIAVFSFLGGTFCQAQGFLETKKQQETPAETTENPVKETHAETKKQKVKSEQKPETSITQVIKSEERVPATEYLGPQISLSSKDACFNLAFQPSEKELFACDQPVNLTYTKRDCGNLEAQEIGETEAVVSCPSSAEFELKFKSKDGTVKASLLTRRQTSGRRGTTISYNVKSWKFEKSDEPLKDPKILPLDGSLPQNVPTEFVWSGYGAGECENSDNFGFSGAAGIPSFDSNQDGAKRRTCSFLSNIQFDISKDRTSMTTVFEIGEIFFGDSASGGAGGARQRIVEIRNIYGTHKLFSWLSVQGGIIDIVSDPRSFIINDHYTGVQAKYSTDLINGNLYYGTPTNNKPGAKTSTFGQTNGYVYPDSFFGASGSMTMFNGLQSTIYVAARENIESVNDATGAGQRGTSKTYWAGATFGYTGLSPFYAEATFINNWGDHKGDNSNSDTMSATLIDGKVGYLVESLDLDVNAEALMTSAKENEDGSIGKRNTFVSLINTAYLLTVATSDGVDDAPGAPKDTVLGGLTQREGLRLLVGKVTKNWGKRFTTFLRYAKLDSAVKNTTTQNTDMGSEVDFGAVYQLSPGTTLQFDWGRLDPGTYYGTGPKDAASLAALKMKFAF